MQNFATTTLSKIHHSNKSVFDLTEGDEITLRHERVVHPHGLLVPSGRRVHRLCRNQLQSTRCS